MSKTLRDVYFEQFAKNCLAAVEMTRKKNEGYTAGSDDPFKNFRAAADLATLPGKEQITVEQTILSRIADKISRFKSLTVRPGAATYDESIEDTLMDFMVYTNILLTYVQLGKPSAETEYRDEENWENDGGALIGSPLSTEDINILLQPEKSLVAKAGEAIGKLFNWPVVTK